MATVQDTRKADTPTGGNPAVAQNTLNTAEEQTRAQGIGAQIHDSAQEASTYVREKAQEVSTQIADKAHETGDYLRHKAQDLSTQAQELGTQTRDTVSEYYEHGRESLRELPHTLEGQIREHPIEALLVAGGIGLVLGLLWRRS